MLFNWGIEAAKNNVDKYERKLDRIELKYVIKIIKSDSRRGYTCIKWQGNLRKGTIDMLKDYGYKVTHPAYCVYKIYW